MEPTAIVKKVMVAQDKEISAWRTIDGKIIEGREEAIKHEEAYLAKEEFLKIANAVDAFKTLPSVEIGVDFYVLNLKTEKELEIVHNFIKSNFGLDEWTNLMSYLRQKVFMTVGKSIVDGTYIVTVNIIEDKIDDLNRCLQILTNF